MDEDDLTLTWSAADCAATIRRAGLALRLAGFVQFLGWIPTLWLRDFLGWHGILDWNDIEALGPLLALQVLSCVILGAWIGVAGRSAQWLENPSRVRNGAYLALLPTSAAALVSLPIGLWMLYLLRQPAVREEFLKSEKKAVAERIFQEEWLLHRPSAESPWHALGWIVARAWQRILILLGGLTCALLALGAWSAPVAPFHQPGQALPQPFDDSTYRLLAGLAGLGLVFVTWLTFKTRYSPTRAIVTLMVCTIAILASGALVLTLNPHPVLRATRSPYVTLFIGIFLGVLSMRELQQGIHSAEHLRRDS